MHTPENDENVVETKVETKKVLVKPPLPDLSCFPDNSQLEDAKPIFDFFKIQKKIFDNECKAQFGGPKEQKEAQIDRGYLQKENISCQKKLSIKFLRFHDGIPKNAGKTSFEKSHPIVTEILKNFK